MDMQSVTLKSEPAQRRLMMAFAHPDDESFGPSGTIAHYVRQNVGVHYVCATRGEAGDADPDLLKEFASLADLRTQELMCAANHLGLSAVHFLEYQDSGMENSPQNKNPDCLVQAPLEEVVEKITLLIRRIRPQVLVTFDPQGGYFHPDHIKMHQAASRAFAAAGDPEQFPHQLGSGLSVYQPQKLYYTAFPRTMVKWTVRMLRLMGRDPTKWGRNGDIDLLRIAAVSQKVTTKIKTAPYFGKRRLAVGCHASQTWSNLSLRRELLNRLLLRWDKYTRVVPAFNHSGIERDLFAGIVEEVNT